MRQQILSVTLAAALVVLFCMTWPSTAMLRCGVERWPVKTASDPDVVYLFRADGTLKRTRNTTIQKLIDYDYPFLNIRGLPRSSYTRRVPPLETNIWRVQAKLTGYKSEPDEDYHLVI